MSGTESKNDVEMKEAKEKEEQIKVVFTEDDAFEEFEFDRKKKLDDITKWIAWKQESQDKDDAMLWTTDWGDEDIDDNFEKILKDELTSQNEKHQKTTA
ncbi:hypothetical protein RFI_13888 [Reticulomyxa filosa]|uniref:Uncharacterized protein n=1 Tax=Reticulomyxa filosa TaxID=46433 RepID=X6NAG9_RETFI|nr:hypothetical protein RFI_13888 [Reticulomyxa filosa]|eukprot:ETO23295.1 hypothetical protein RFI_13888 [Reticulomyxa filosa]